MSKSLNILLVDDDATLRFTFKTIMEQAGHTVVGEAADGKQAVEMYADLKPDVTLMDMNMPVMDGLDALVSIRAKDVTAAVVMVTSVNDLPVWEDCMMAGAIGYIRKDAPFEEIAPKIAVLWEEHTS